ncbi:hypothetical protein [Aureivirga marina]|uniref:hypothetical protein n=1 Tax=Aureivirga marina TaxID=1182451 RepID=UPI0018CB334E|nr:hypothetical protein [Aureivirga marina]
MKKQFDIKKFEVLETSNEVLKGGFSTAYTGAGLDAAFKEAKNVLSNCSTNNCHGGNCASGCGSDSPSLPSEA